jgi:hypothetical protein
MADVIVMVVIVNVKRSLRENVEIDALTTHIFDRTSTRVDRAVTGLPTHSTALPSEMDPGRNSERL